MVILLSRYFSRAKENKNKEKIEIKIEGINVNNEKKSIYFLLVFDPCVLIFCFREFFTSRMISIKKNISKKIFETNRICKLNSLSSIKPLFINVKNVTNPTNKVIKYKVIHKSSAVKSRCREVLTLRQREEKSSIKIIKNRLISPTHIF